MDLVRKIFQPKLNGICAEMVLMIFCVVFFSAQKMSVLDYLNQGNVLVGDGGMTYCLEKRGYVKAGPWTPECTVEDPDAGYE